ncbi:MULTISPECIES: spore coat protein U domain-containing protein [Paraburkholderia]|uniref:spore coat protein U domain-containing protein n=1 Tax=Paraburkholderia TaxID=1822464 RepID=UPI002250425A|nr:MULTISPECIES: spore coat protein U domain-containing protein [Paraburkholderia]MCX4161726.1 spore coat protein U domain-containing protein [Paraburkholderia megapolitana]MDN7157223.1 spore coat U domain-containing protein [Paraburkholderia sp. CHISQ3]MDQ6494268.1 spore coat U domain-containing protein [Paraburkholderia megapolitana]
MKTHRKVWAAFACASLCAGVHAQINPNPLTGRINSTLVLERGCAIDSGRGSVGEANWGTLDFGTQPSGFTGSLNAATGRGPNSTQVTCSPDITSVNVTVDAGQNGGAGTGIGNGSRALTNGTSFVPYEVYADNLNSLPYPVGGVQAVRVPTPGNAFPIPVFGVASKTSSSALAAGTYIDVLGVTLGW